MISESPRVLPANFVLAGISGSGKSTVGRHLAILLGFGFLDLDTLIEKMSGKTVTQIFDSEGETGFRTWEVRALEMASRVKSHVLALGGGALQDPYCLGLAKSVGPLIWLKPSADEVARRLYMRVEELEKRPLFKDLVNVVDKEARKKSIRERIEAMTDSRSEMYQHADIVLDGGFVTPETSACQLREILASMELIDLRLHSVSNRQVVMR